MKANLTKKIIVVVGLALMVCSQANAFNLTSANLQVVDTVSKYGADSASCVMNLSLYRESFKLWKANNYNAAGVVDMLVPWREAFINCPRSMESIYVDGAKIMQSRVINEKDKAVKEKLIDTLMMVYDQRIKYFPNHNRTGESQLGNILGRKGIDLFTYAPDRYVETHDVLLSSINADELSADGTVLIFYFRSVIKMAKTGNIDSTSIIDAYDRIMDLVDNNIKNLYTMGDSAKVEVYKNIKGSIESNFEPFAKCEDLVRIYKQKFANNPDDIELLKKITAILDKKDCTDDPLYLQASEKLHKLQPSPESAYLLGRLMIKEEKYGEAAVYFEEATQSENIDRAHNAYKLLAECLRATKNYSRARQMAYKALELDPMDGSPYIIIGNMYAASAKDCGDGDFYSRVAYWAAVDKYKKARQVDSSLEETASKLISTYSQHFPSKETIFFHDYSEGETYTVECWINEKTTIRASY